MSDQSPANTNDRLRLGIEAARTGKENEARDHLIAVLKQDPNNIPAMLWLAFVLPSPENTIRLLGETLMRSDRGRVRVNNDAIYREAGGGGHHHKHAKK